MSALDLADVPRRGASRLRKVSPPGRARRRVGVERLEPRIALTVVPLDVEAAEEISASGCPLCGPGGCRHTTNAVGETRVECHFFDGSRVSRAAAETASPFAPLSETFSLHSRPGATKTIYLDFTGHTTSGTSWNTSGPIVTPAYDIDGDPGAFSDTERRNIQDIWARVVEDFSPFDVNVTTAEPTVEDLQKFGAGDTRWGIRVVIGRDAGSVAPGAGGGGVSRVVQLELRHPMLRVS